MTELKEIANRTYKARLFEMIYSQKKELLELYNAVNGTNYDDPEKLEINTLKNAIYMSMHNDEGCKPVWEQTNQDTNPKVSDIFQRN